MNAGNVARSEVIVSPILWSTTSEAPDGLALTPAAIIVVGGETITAFDRASGTMTWSSMMSDTSGPTPVLVTPDGVVVVAPPHESVQAFDVATGQPTSVPVGADLPDAAVASDPLPDGYTFGAAGLSYRGTLIWSELTSSRPTVARLGDLTVINDFNHGLRVVDDRGTIQAAPALGPREYDECPILIADDVAVTVTSDGVLYAIGASET